MGPITPPVNVVLWEEGTEITLDSEVEAPGPGWTFGYASVQRVGSLVAVHIEATYDADAPGAVCTLPAQFAPGGIVFTPDGQFNIEPDGDVNFPGSTAGGGSAVLQLVYAAGQASP